MLRGIILRGREGAPAARPGFGVLVLFYFLVFIYGG